VPYLGVSVRDLQHDLFYLVYFAVTIALVATYVRVERVEVAAIFRRWRWSLGLGVLLAVFLVFNVFNTEDATARPHGAYFVFELLWRGVGYGVVDTLLLTVFPCFVAYKFLHGPVMIATAHRRAHARRPLLGLRRQPGRLALAAMRVPRPLYHRGWGRMLDHTFLLIAHQGRTTGKRRETVAMALAYDPDTHGAVGLGPEHRVDPQPPRPPGTADPDRA
jgi:hypothetical protein